MKHLTVPFAVVTFLYAVPAFSQGIAPNIRIHPNPTTFQFEPSITTHPTNASVILASAVAMNNGVMRIGWYYSTNAGLTWTGRDTLPTHTALTTKMNDPTAGIDLNGNLFVSGIFGSNTIFVARSTDRGSNWIQQTVATAGVAEKPHMAIDRDPASAYRNNIYVTYTDNSTSPHPPLFSRSTDGGQNFSFPVSIGGAAGSTIGINGGVGPNIAVGPDSMLYVTWTGFDSNPRINQLPWHLGFNRSTDGGMSWGTPKAIRINKFNADAHGLSFFNFPSMAVDGSSSGPRRGWIYIAYADSNSSATDIFLVRSTDRGDSWSAPVRVNQDIGSARDQWQPWISVDPSTGKLFVLYYDARNFPNNDSAQVYLSFSRDGGQTFEDRLVSDVPFLPTAVASFSVVPSYMGTYIGVAALRDTVWACWNDNRTGLMLENRRLHQVYTTRSLVTSVKMSPFREPEAYRLNQNYPNPFNPSTEIQFSLPQRGHVTLTVFDLLGRVVAMLLSENLSAGSYSTRWDATSMPSGVYFYRLQAGSFIQTRKLLLLK